VLLWREVGNHAHVLHYHFPFLSAGLHFKLMVVCERRSLARATFCGSSV